MTRSEFIVLISLCALIVLSLLMTGCNKASENTTPETNIKTEENTKTPDSTDKTPEKTDADMTADGETETPSTTAIESETPDTKPKFPEYDLSNLIWRYPAAVSYDVELTCGRGCSSIAGHDESYMVGMGDKVVPGINFDTTKSNFIRSYKSITGRDIPENPVISLFVIPTAFDKDYKILDEYLEDEDYNMEKHTMRLSSYLDYTGLNTDPRYHELAEIFLNMGIELAEERFDKMGIPHTRVRIEDEKGLNILVKPEQVRLLYFEDMGLGIYTGLEILEYKDGIITVPEEFRWE